MTGGNRALATMQPSAYGGRFNIAGRLSLVLRSILPCSFSHHGWRGSHTVRWLFRLVVPSGG
jgi:hypothetical protein